MTNNSENIKIYLQNLGISQLTAMQSESLETFTADIDMVLLSPTGSGKTIAYLLPLLKFLDNENSGIQAVVITPTRELALQIEDVFKSMKSSFKVTSSYGGHSYRIEKNNFSSPPAILIGTPGRLADHIRVGNVSLASVTTLILDEFDKSLEIGFEHEMSFIISKLASLKRKILCSATNLEIIPEFTGIKNPVIVNYLLKKREDNNLIINILKSRDKDKLASLFSLICELGSVPTIVFCNHRDAVERISRHLQSMGIINDYFHGGLEQSERERMLVRFKNGSSNLLITTDLASRGLDIPEVSCIIHYQLPQNKESFIHRNGRTARMKSKGSAFLILSEDEIIPEYIEPGYINYEPGNRNEIPAMPRWQTLYIGGGRKDKINKTDIAGFLFKQGGLNKDELGLIEVKDYHSYAAIKSDLIQALVIKIKNSKIKNKKLKIQISY